MKIIPATPKDEANIKTLLQTCELPFQDLTRAHLENFLVIRENGQFLGTIGLEVCGADGLLRSLAVSETVRGQGLGLQLVKQIEELARARQLVALYLLTTTAEKFFAHLGYQVIPRESAPAALQETAEFQSICPASAVCMWKQL